MEYSDPHYKLSLKFVLELLSTEKCDIFVSYIIRLFCLLLEKKVYVDSISLTWAIEEMGTTQDFYNPTVSIGQFPNSNLERKSS